MCDNLLMAIFLEISHHFPMRWTSFFRRAQVALDALLRTPLEVRLSWAVKRGNTRRLVELLDGDGSGWSLDKPLSPFKHKRATCHLHEGHTLLHLAVAGGHLGCVKVLVERGATVDMATRWGFTPAMMAALNADLSILYYLELQGADVARRLPSTSTTFIEDYVGPTIPEVFKTQAGECFEAAKAKELEGCMKEALSPTAEYGKGPISGRL